MSSRRSPRKRPTRKKYSVSIDTSASHGSSGNGVIAASPEPLSPYSNSPRLGGSGGSGGSGGVVGQSPHKQQGRIRVYSSILFEDLLAASEAPVRQARQVQGDDDFHGFTQVGETVLDTGYAKALGGSLSERRERRRRRREEERKKKARLMIMREAERKKLEENDKRVREHTKAQLQRKQEQFEEMLVQMDAASGFIAEIDEYIAAHDAQKHQKREALYAEWERTVFAPIQKQIETQLAGVSTAEIEARRQAMFEEYIQATNRNQGLFRDIVKPDEYDPFKAQQHGITYSLQGVEDPLKRALIEAEKERKATQKLMRSTQSSSDAGTTKKNKHGKRGKRRGRPRRGREVLDVQKWDKLDSTPHGRYGGEAEERRVGNNPTRPVPPNARSHVVLDHFNVSRDASVTKAEFFPKGKQVFPGKQASTGF